MSRNDINTMHNDYMKSLKEYTRFPSDQNLTVYMNAEKKYKESARNTDDLNDVNKNINTSKLIFLNEQVSNKKKQIDALTGNIKTWEISKSDKHTLELNSALRRFNEMFNDVTEKDFASLFSVNNLWNTFINQLTLIADVTNCKVDYINDNSDHNASRLANAIIELLKNPDVDISRIENMFKPREWTTFNNQLILIKMIKRPDGQVNVTIDDLFNNKYQGGFNKTKKHIRKTYRQKSRKRRKKRRKKSRKKRTYK